MSPPISSSVKEKVIQLHLDGKGRNEIAEILNHSHIRISQGSVTNILNTWKREQGNSDTSQPVASPKAVLSKATPQASPPSSSPDNNMGSPFLNRVANPTPTVTTVSTPVKVNPPHEPSSPDLQSSLSQNSEGDVPSIESMKDPEGPKTQEEQGPNGSRTYEGF